MGSQDLGALRWERQIGAGFTKKVWEGEGRPALISYSVVWERVVFVKESE